MGKLMTRSQTTRLKRYNSMVRSDNLAADSIAALIGAILIVGPFAIILFNLI